MGVVRAPALTTNTEITVSFDPFSTKKIQMLNELVSGWNTLCIMDIEIHKKVARRCVDLKTYLEETMFSNKIIPKYFRNRLLEIAF